MESLANVAGFSSCKIGHACSKRRTWTTSFQPSLLKVKAVMSRLVSPSFLSCFFLVKLRCSILLLIVQLMDEVEANFALTNITVSLHFDTTTKMSVEDRMQCFLASHNDNLTTAYLISSDGSTFHLGSIDQQGTAPLAVGTSEVGLQRITLSGMLDKYNGKFLRFILFCF